METHVASVNQRQRHHTFNALMLLNARRSILSTFCPQPSLECCVVLFLLYTRLPQRVHCFILHIPDDLSTACSLCKVRSVCDSGLVNRVSINNKLSQNINLVWRGIIVCCSVNVGEPSRKQDVLFAFVSAGWNSASVNSQLHFVKALRCRDGEKKRESDSSVYPQTHERVQTLQVMALY